MEVWLAGGDLPPPLLVVPFRFAAFMETTTETQGVIYLLLQSRRRIYDLTKHL